MYNPKTPPPQGQRQNRRGVSNPQVETCLFKKGILTMTNVEKMGPGAAGTEGPRTSATWKPKKEIPAMTKIVASATNVNSSFFDDLYDPVGAEREEAFHTWYYAEKAKAERGEPAMVRIIDNNVVELLIPRWVSVKTVLRHTLLDTGYAPIPINGKIPPLEEWQKKLDVSHQEIISWDTNRKTIRAHNTGLLTERTPGFDIDILDAAAADAVEQMVRDRFKERGAILVRIGRPPKRLIPFRSEAKRFVTLLDPDCDFSRSRPSMTTWNAGSAAEDHEPGPFARIIHGTLDKCWNELCRLNEQGAGIFITVNATDGKGRSEKNVRAGAGAVQRSRR